MVKIFAINRICIEGSLNKKKKKKKLFHHKGNKNDLKKSQRNVAAALECSCEVRGCS